MKLPVFCVVIILSSCLIGFSLCEDEENTEERDPWDKSTDRYHHDNNGDNDLRVDVTESSESEVHTERKSKLRGEIQNIEKEYGKMMKKQARKKKLKAKKKNKKKPKKIKTKIAMNLKSGGGLRSVPKVDVETKQQFDDATDEKDPIDDVDPNERAQAFSSNAQKKAFNYWADFYPGSLWEYPYPYFHPQYHCDQEIDCPCAKAPMAAEAKIDDHNLFSGVPLKKPKKSKKKQLIPSHYYGPPSAGWGSFEPGKTGCGWGTPYWYKKRHTIKSAKNHGSRQLIPSHYYGPPSAGWGSFEPGKTGCGWGVPYWYKKRDNIHKKKKKHGSRQLIPSHYYGPPSAGWGSFEPGKTGCGWGVPYWYKSQIPLKPKSERASRKFFVTGNDPLGLGHTGNAGWDSGLGRGRGSTAWGRPNKYGWGPYAWHKGGKNNLDFMAWFGPNSFGTNGWGGQGWVSNYGMMYNGKPLGMPNELAGFGNVGSDVSRIDETIGQGEFAGTTSNLAKGSRARLLQAAGNQGLGLTEAEKMGVAIGNNAKIQHVQSENIVEQGVAKRIQTPDVSSEDGPSESLTSDVLQVSNNENSDGKSSDDANQSVSEYSEKQSSDIDQGIAEVVKDANGDTKVSNIDEQLPENAETSTALPAPATVDLTGLAEPNSKVSSKEKPKSQSVEEKKPSADISKENTSAENSTSNKSESQGSMGKFVAAKGSHEMGELQTIKTTKPGGTKAASPTEKAAQEELKEKVDQLIKQAKASEKGKEERVNTETKAKEEEALRKQEEAYSTIKSKAANTEENLKLKAKIKTELFTSKRHPQLQQPKLKTVKTEAANEKPLTI